MYLSRVQIDTNNRRKIKDLTHLGAYHNWVEQSFPNEISGHVRLRHLWRIDQLGGKQYLLVLSADKPDLEQLEEYGVPGTAASKDYDLFLQGLSLGETLNFRLTANPTHSVPQEGQRGRVYPHVTVRHQMEWLVQRAPEAGFRINESSAPAIVADGAKDVDKELNRLAFNLVSRDQPILRHKGMHVVRVRRVTYEGVLTITDLDKFKQTLTNGLGREKAYGMGLMTVIPVK
ncbi:type I-E CRISPR-associated protein Cas6/Cse3/CasE [Lacticaseibacillus thailandensis]|uniref:Crispr-associated protein n=1 Tax=Lacticaseibacillus thailandensis DSM 22698 = JCM 13996 TaxID=1423810 RepID=A0A0R2CGM5_9LACO|nr:type I-E CRISPR-associated protein Cas6/Cse3/CasE [Lacticaseibacillus thailandensis]KRM87625.1 crispr-associated protein [Lacticaseibacillus thailandensis DSM 22698 = JCM 13996]